MFGQEFDSPRLHEGPLVDVVSSIMVLFCFHIRTVVICLHFIGYLVSNPPEINEKYEQSYDFE